MSRRRVFGIIHNKVLIIVVWVNEIIEICVYFYEINRKSKPNRHFKKRQRKKKYQKQVERRLQI